MEPSKHEWRTAITTYSDKEILIRGYTTDDLIELGDFAATIYLVMKGELPSKNQSKVLNACLSAVIDHGIAPSEIVTRYIAASGVPVQACVAGGLLTIGDVHGGAGEAFAKLLQEKVIEAEKSGASIKSVAEDLVVEANEKKARLPGYGHPMHPSGDPRAKKLTDVAKRHNVAGKHVELAEEIENSIERIRGKHIPMNIDGATASIISDLGLSWHFARPLLLVSRAAGLASHAIEEVIREKGWRSVDNSKVLYDGPKKKALSV